MSHPHDFRRTVATQVARATTLANATALLGHADEMTTARHYVQRISVAPDLRMVIDQLVSQASEDATGGSEKKGVAPNDEGPHFRMIMRVGALRVAVAVGFEPTVDFHPHTLSRRAP